MKPNEPPPDLVPEPINKETAIVQSSDILNPFRLATDRGSTEKEFPSTHFALFNFLDHACDAVTLIDRTGKVLYRSARAIELMGGMDSAALPLTSFDFIYPEDLPLSIAIFQDLVSRPGAVLRNQRIRVQYPSLPIHWVEYTLRNCLDLPGIDAIVIHWRDVTTEVENERRYQFVLENIRGIPWEVDGETLTFTYVGPQVEQLLGYPLSDWYRPGFWADHLHPEDRETAVSYCLQKTHSGLDHTLEYRMVAADGRIVWILDSVRVDVADSKRKLTGLFLDITDRKNAETELRQSEARLQACVHNTPHVAIQWYDPQGRVVLWNEGSQRMFGFSVEEAMGKTLDQLIRSPDEAKEFLLVLKEIDRTGKPVGPVESHFRRKDGAEGISLSTLFSIPAPNEGNWFVCMDVDLTALRHIEEQMRHAQKLESLGVLAGGVAHDFNNLLTSILGYASLAEVEISSNSPAIHSIREVISAAKRSAELTQQLLAYGGKGKFVIQPIHLSKLVEEMTRLLQTGISKKATLRMHCPDDLPLIEGDATQIRQVVMNLITNASDALKDDEGSIEIRTGTIHIKDPVSYSPYAANEQMPGEYVFLEVIDSGCGMNPATLDRIFDPFFSTKFTGRGLGLAAVLGIVRGHHGLIQVESEIGKGSRFQILFPRSASNVSIAVESTIAPVPWKGEGTIVVIDDEPAIRSLAAFSLRRVGFTVVEGKDGEEGKEFFRRHRGECVAVLVDLTMPRSHGTEVLEDIRQHSPKLPVILMSGYTEEEVQSSLADGNTFFLQKPFTPITLTELLRKILPSKT